MITNQANKLINIIPTYANMQTIKKAKIETLIEAYKEEIENYGIPKLPMFEEQVREANNIDRINNLQESINQMEKIKWII